MLMIVFGGDISNKVILIEGLNGEFNGDASDNVYVNRNSQCYCVWYR